MKPSRVEALMFNLSPSAADAVYTWSGILTIVGAIFAVVGALGAFWSGFIREQYANERIASNEAQTAIANKDAAEARLETERIRAQMAWRQVTQQQRDAIVASLSGKKIELSIDWVGSDPEATAFAEDLAGAFRAAGLAPAGYQGWERAVGLTLLSRQEKVADALAVANALKLAGFPFTTRLSGPKDHPSGTGINLLVGSKPPP